MGQDAHQGPGCWIPAPQQRSRTRTGRLVEAGRPLEQYQRLGSRRSAGRL